MSMNSLRCPFSRGMMIIAAATAPLKCLTGQAESPVGKGGKGGLSRHFFPACFGRPCRGSPGAVGPELANGDRVSRRADAAPLSSLRSDRRVTESCLSGGQAAKNEANCETPYVFCPDSRSRPLRGGRGRALLYSYASFRRRTVVSNAEDMEHSGVKRSACRWVMANRRANSSIF